MKYLLPEAFRTMKEKADKKLVKMILKLIKTNNKEQKENVYSSKEYRKDWAATPVNKEGRE